MPGIAPAVETKAPGESPPCGTVLGCCPATRLRLLFLFKTWPGPVRPKVVTPRDESRHWAVQTLPELFRPQLLVQGSNMLGMACLFRNNREAWFDIVKEISAY